MKKISRRRFLKGSAVTAGALGLGMKSWAMRTEPVEAMIIGSGLGGAIAALRLAQAGINTVVLERGKCWPISPEQDTFATSVALDARAAWLSNQAGALPPFTPVERFTGLLETVTGNNMTVLCGAGVGGSTLNYNAITLIPKKQLFEKVFPREIDFDEMVDVFYPRVESVLQASPVPADLLATPFFESTRVNLQQAEKAGLGHRPAPLAVNWDIVRQEINGTRRPSIIAGECWYGVNSGAKNSVDHNYLPMAEATGKIQILPLHVVTDIFELGPHRFMVVANEIDTNGMVLRTRSFTTRNLFMAAGSVGTTKLMVRAKAKGTIPNLEEAGNFWSQNGDFVSIRQGLGPNNAGQGGPAGHILIEDPRPQPLEPSKPTNMIELVFPKGNAFQGGSLYVGLGIPPLAGSLTFDPATDSVTVNWPAMNDPRVQAFQNGANDLVNTLNNANPGSSSAFLSVNITAHPASGMGIGKVTDQFGRVLNHPGLFCCDGSILPLCAPCVNPSFTIAALAERCMQEVIRRDLVGD